MNHVLLPETVATVLNLRQDPALLDADQAAAKLGGHRDWIPYFVKGGFLAYIGEPTPGAAKYLYFGDVVALRNDRERLSAALKYLREQIAAKNAHATRKSRQRRVASTSSENKTRTLMQ